MTSVRLAYVFVVIFAAIVHSSDVAVSAMEISDTASTENADAGRDYVLQRLRGTEKEEVANEERILPVMSGYVGEAEKINGLLSMNTLTSLQKTIGQAETKSANTIKNSGVVAKFFKWLKRNPRDPRTKSFIQWLRSFFLKKSKTTGEEKKFSSSLRKDAGTGVETNAPVDVPAGIGKETNAPVDVLAGIGKETNAPVDVPAGIGKETNAPVDVPAGLGKKKTVSWTENKILGPSPKVK
ncbi:unnamed protein product [Peronospora effusa]|uniref:RxLR effector protein n=1 Tax=Peronospora effusa TaxID=542832 RepID=A0A425C1T9_9STRA|nr:hypothetical protein DD237_008570 [Peronospora effusa]CAI5703212.1 unnamed protein product [Peronospora effusa]